MAGQSKEARPGLNSPEADALQRIASKPVERWTLTDVRAAIARVGDAYKFADAAKTGSVSVMKDYFNTDAAAKLAITTAAAADLEERQKAKPKKNTGNNKKSDDDDKQGDGNQKTDEEELAACRAQVEDLTAAARTAQEKLKALEAKLAKGGQTPSRSTDTGIPAELLLKAMTDFAEKQTRMRRDDLASPNSGWPISQQKEMIIEYLGANINSIIIHERVIGATVVALHRRPDYELRQLTSDAFALASWTAARDKVLEFVHNHGEARYWRLMDFIHPPGKAVEFPPKTLYTSIAMPENTSRGERRQIWEDFHHIAMLVLYHQAQEFRGLVVNWPRVLYWASKPEDFRAMEIAELLTERRTGHAAAVQAQQALPALPQHTQVQQGPAQYLAQPSLGSGRQCHICGSLFHLQRQCPQAAALAQGQAQGQTQGRKSAGKKKHRRP